MSSRSTKYWRLSSATLDSFSWGRISTRNSSMPGRSSATHTRKEKEVKVSGNNFKVSEVNLKVVDAKVKISGVNV